MARQRDNSHREQREGEQRLTALFFHNAANKTVEAEGILPAMKPFFFLLY